MKYFTIKELSYSLTAKAEQIDNTPSAEGISNLTALIEQVLDPCREQYGKPINVTSGYRCVALNRSVGGAVTSQHLKGQAADIVGKTTSETRKIFEILRKQGNYDQLLYERNSKGSIWVHVSYRNDGKNRKQCIDNYKAK